MRVCHCRFPHGQLIEVNAHSLFSKWFSESGKLVSRLFAKIMELVSLTASTHNPLEFTSRCRRIGSGLVSGKGFAVEVCKVSVIWIAVVLWVYKACPRNDSPRTCRVSPRQ